MLNKENTKKSNHDNLSKKWLILWVIFLYIIYLIFKTPIDLHNLGISNIESYYLIDAYSVCNGHVLYKDFYENKGPLQILFYVFSLLLGNFNELAIVRVRILQSITYFISLFFLTFSANLIFKKKLITLITPLAYIYLPIIFKGLWGEKDMQGVFLAEGELIMSPWLSLSLYFLSKFVIGEKKWQYIFLSGIFSSLATVTKLSGASFSITIFMAGILSLLFLRRSSIFYSTKYFLCFCLGTIIPILLVYLFLFCQGSINDFHYYVIYENLIRTGIPISESIKTHFLKIILKNSAIFLLIVYYLISTLTHLTTKKNLASIELQFHLIFSCWIIISIYAVISPRLYASHYYQNLWLSSCIPIAHVINRFLEINLNKLYKVFISVLILFSSWNYNLINYYLANYECNYPSILNTNKIYDSTTIESQDKFEKWLKDNTRLPILKASDLIRWTSKPNDTMYIWPLGALIYLYSSVKPAVFLQPEMVLYWYLNFHKDKEKCNKFLNNYFLRSINEIIKNKPSYIVNTEALTPEYDEFSIFKKNDFSMFLRSNYKVLFTIELTLESKNIRRLTNKTITIYRRT